MGGQTMLIWFLIAAMWLGCADEKESISNASPNVSSTESTNVLTVDLSDDWTPYLFSESDGTGQPIKNDFRETFIALANERPYASPLEIAADKAALKKIAPRRRAELSDTQIAPKVHPYLEVYGILPTFSVLRKRAVDEIDRACFREVDRSKLSSFGGFVSYSSNREARRRAKQAQALTAMLKGEMSTKGFAAFEEYRANVKDEDKRRNIDLAIEYEAIKEAQRLLKCEGLFEKEDGDLIEGGLCYATHLALLRFEQKNRIFGWGYFGGETLSALKKSPEERLYDTLVRVTAERTADAAFIIEDGTATINGAPSVYRDSAFKTHSVRNLIGEFTNAVLKKMGIDSPADCLVFLRTSNAESFRHRSVQIKMPARPAYYSDRMKLSMEIDRGDVYYDFPYENDKKKFQPRRKPPTLTLFVRYGNQNIPLVRMNTSIGGWQDERAEDGYLYLKYKNTEDGEGAVREIIAAPTWVPPESTPFEEIIRNVSARGKDVAVPDANVIGPWFTSAYGLVAAIHLKRISKEQLVDTGIRSHGSYDYTSVSKRYSHGCHRLLNHLAIRLYDFVLRHTPHRRVGQRAVNEVRRFSFNRTDYKIGVRTAGYVFELLEPIPVKTLKGNIQGAEQKPIEGYVRKPNVRYGADAMFVR
jgi:hypothetical protein